MRENDRGICVMAGRVGTVACVQTCGARHTGYSATGLHDPYELSRIFFFNSRTKPTMP
jgi:hypothetical protein